MPPENTFSLDPVTPPVRAVAEKLYYLTKHETESSVGIERIAEALEEAVANAHREIAEKQALIYGESVMLGGKVVTNEELYKQPTDYINEAVLAERAECEKIASEFKFAPCPSEGHDVRWCGFCDAGSHASDAIATAIRQRTGEGTL